MSAPRRGAALLLAAWVGTLAPLPICAAEPAALPRVFLDTAERRALTADRMAGRPLRREAGATGAVAPSAAAPPAATGDGAASGSAAAPAGVRVRVDGVTVGAGAARAVWIGGERVADGGRWRGYRVQVMRDGARLVAADGSVRQVRVGTEIRR